MKAKPLYTVPRDLGMRKCERCGALAQWGAGPHDKHVLCLNCANDWHEYTGVHPINNRMSNWESLFADFLATRSEKFTE